MRELKFSTAIELLAAGHDRGLEALRNISHGRMLIRESFQGSQDEFPEVTWTGTEFRVLPDE